jgi:hypothetical protein
MWSGIWIPKHGSVAVIQSDMRRGPSKLLGFSSIVMNVKFMKIDKNSSILTVPVNLHQKRLRFHLWNRLGG